MEDTFLRNFNVSGEGRHRKIIGSSMHLRILYSLASGVGAVKKHINKVVNGKHKHAIKGMYKRCIGAQKLYNFNLMG